MHRGWTAPRVLVAMWRNKPLVATVKNTFRGPVMPQLPVEDLIDVIRHSLGKQQGHRNVYSVT
jgi:hypothetical protein